MTLYRDSNKLESMPNEEQFKQWKDCITDSEYYSFIKTLHDHLDEKPDSLFRVPPMDIAHKNYSIFDNKLKEVHDHLINKKKFKDADAKTFLSQIVRDAIQSHEKNWFIKQDDLNDELNGVTYEPSNEGLDKQLSQTPSQAR